MQNREKQRKTGNHRETGETDRGQQRTTGEIIGKQEKTGKRIGKQKKT